MSLQGDEKIAAGGLSIAGESLYNKIRSVAISEISGAWTFVLKCRVFEISIDDLENFSVFRSNYLKYFAEPAPYVTPSEWIKILIILRTYKCSDMQTECSCCKGTEAELDY